MSEQISLWGDDFNIEMPKSDTKKLIEKVKNPKVVKTLTIDKALKSKTVSLEDKLSLIEAEVDRILGKYKSDTVVIKTKESLIEYIDKAIDNGEIAIDTETNNSLDPLTCKLMGPCIYTPGMKNAYIPINHIDLFTRERLDWQLTEDDIKEQFDRLSNTNIIMHNGKFDYEVLKCTCGLVTKCYWDTMIAARLLNENERAGLKEQYRAKIDPTQEKYDIEKLFGSVEYAVVNPDLFALYSATDPYMTYKLYEWQKKQFENPEMSKLYSLFMDIEMPIMEVSAEMELTGVCIDKEYSERLSLKYNNKLDEIDKRISEELDNYKPLIDEWRLSEDANFKPKTIDKTTGKQKIDPKGNLMFGKSKNEQLKDPIEITSPTQLAILLYDIIKVGVIDKSSPRGTGEDIIKQIDIPLCKLILERRSLAVLINTFIDKLPNCVNERDGRLHGHFNQLGTDTGRFSSTEPNLQNIPSGEHSIRLMFTASPGYIMVGSDFSSQEPRLMAEYSQDKFLLDSLAEGKDPYATIATGVYKNNYEDNLEHYPDGSLYPEGSKRRKSVKGLLLGILYGMGVQSIAEMLKTSKDEAQEILDDFYNGFPGIKIWMDKTLTDAKENGYVEDFWGRRRRLTDIMIPDYTVERKRKDNYTDFNPILGCKGYVGKDDDELIKYFREKIDKLNGYDKNSYEKIKQEADSKGIYINNNIAFKRRAERQCVNARIQGGAATMTKKAMLAVYNDEEMRRLGFKLLIAVHDELIGECPIENADAVKERLSYLMINSAKPTVNVQMKCDAEEFSSWYYDVYSVDIKEEYEELKKSNPDNAFDLLVEEHIEFTKERLEEIINDN